MHFASFGGGSWHLVLQLVIVGQNVQVQPAKRKKRIVLHVHKIHVHVYS